MKSMEVKQLTPAIIRLYQEYEKRKKAKKKPIKELLSLINKKDI
jgi:hypothetical protein